MIDNDSSDNVRSIIQPLLDQVLANCHRSDARFAGSFSLCGLLLRLRDYYKWEQGFPSYFEPEAADVLSWIEERERLWEDLLEDSTQDLNWLGHQWDPFETDPLNRKLGSFGLYYGAGFAAYTKPSFLLAEVISVKKLGPYRVVYLGRELARDLFTVPAQTRGDEILARTRPLASYIWDAVLNSGATRLTAIDLALEAYDLSRKTMREPARNWSSRFENMIHHEIEPFVRHEYGELQNNVFPRADWQAIVGQNPHTRIELMARTIKDLLADTDRNGRLKYIISQRQTSSLGIFLAQLDGMPARLFPEIVPAFKQFVVDRDWEPIEIACETAYQRAVGLTRQMLTLFHQSRDRSGEWFAQQVETCFYQPLGL